MRTRGVVAGLVAAGVVLAGCASSGSSSGNGSGNAGSGVTGKTLAIGMVNPFSGANAAFGADMNAACVAAVQLVNSQGGVLGNKLKCVPIDSKGDAADGVPAVTKALASVSNMVGIIGPGTDAATATMPLINQAKIPAVGANGDVSFDHNQYTYYWRITPPDDANAKGLMVAAKKLGYTRAAMVMGNDPGAQTNVPAIENGWSKLGGQLVANETLLPGQTSYQTQAAKVAAAHPQVIFTETDPQTAATFFGELKQLGGMTTVIGTEPTFISTWYKAVSGAVGAATLRKYYEGVEQYSATSGPAWKAWVSALKADQGVQNPMQYASDPFAQSYYDSVNMLALAMIKADSTSGPKYNSFIPQVVDPNPTATVVQTFAAGVSALKAGKQIRYIGAVGPIAFDKYHNSSGAFAVVRFTTNGAGPTAPVTILPPQDLNVP